MKRKSKVNLDDELLPEYGFSQLKPESCTHKFIGTARHQVRSRSILLQVLDNVADSMKLCASM